MKMKEDRSIDFTCRYIDDVHSMINPNVADWVPLIYLIKIKAITEMAFSPPHV